MSDKKTIQEKAVSTYARRVPVSKEDAERGYVVIDVYRVQLAFAMTDPCLIHAMKKILCPGVRSGGKSVAQDIQEAAYSLQRWAEMRAEEERAGK